MTADRRQPRITVTATGALWNEQAALAYQAGVMARARAANAVAHPRRPALVRYGEGTA